jgi:type III secretory pathway component EscR
MLAHIPHAILHISWGLAGILFLLIFHSRRAVIGLGLVFGTFYTLLGIIGVLVNNAFGLQLVLGENAFHLIVGPLTLIVTFIALFSRNVTFQKELRNQASSG